MNLTSYKFIDIRSWWLYQKTSIVAWWREWSIINQEVVCICLSFPTRFEEGCSSWLCPFYCKPYTIVQHSCPNQELVINHSVKLCVFTIEHTNRYVKQYACCLNIYVEDKWVSSYVHKLGITSSNIVISWLIKVYFLHHRQCPINSS